MAIILTETTFIATSPDTVINPVTIRGFQVYEVYSTTTQPAQFKVDLSAYAGIKVLRGIANVYIPPLGTSDGLFNWFFQTTNATWVNPNNVVNFDSFESVELSLVFEKTIGVNDEVTFTWVGALPLVPFFILSWQFDADPASNNVQPPQVPQPLPPGALPTAAPVRTASGRGYFEINDKIYTKGQYRMLVTDTRVSLYEIGSAYKVPIFSMDYREFILPNNTIFTSATELANALKNLIYA